MSTRKKVEMLKDISGDKELVYPLVDAEHVLMSDGRSLEEAISQDLSQAVVEHSKSTFKPGAGDNIDVSNSIVDGEPGEIKIEGQTYQNLLDWPEGPQLTHSKPEFEITDGQPVIEGYPVNLLENDSFKELKIKGQTIKNMTSELSSHEFSVENEDIISAIYDKDEKIDYVDEYDSLIIKGKSVVNMLAETCGTPAKTVENEKDIVPNINSTLDIITTDGLYHEAILYGKTLKNELVPYGTEIEEIHTSKVYNDDLGIKVSDNVDMDMALIKGKTLVNIKRNYELHTGNGIAIYKKTTNGHKLTITSNGSRVLVWNLNMNIKPNTKYLIISNIKTSSERVSNAMSFSFRSINENGSVVTYRTNIEAVSNNRYAILTTGSETNLCNGLVIGVHEELIIDDYFEAEEPILLEYQEGMENWEIPYFEGMQSVVNPEVITCNSPVRFGKGGRL